MTEKELHFYRAQIDACIKAAEEDLRTDESDRPNYKREMSLVRTKLQEAKMWAGKCLEVLGAPFPEELRDEGQYIPQTPAPSSTGELGSAGISTPEGV